jgi:hypothetical protein
VKQTEAAGFDHHLVKPVDYEKLQAVLSARCTSNAARGDVGALDPAPVERCAPNT